MYGNDGVLTFAELLGLGACLGFLLFLGLIIYLVYRHTLNVMKKQLNVEES